MSRSARLLSTCAVAATLLSLTPAALAHVSVNPGSAPKGGFQKLAFSVPNERDDSGTVKVEVTFPTDHPIAFVSVKPHPGWTHAVERTPLSSPIEVHGDPISEVVTRVTWTGGAIKPGEFDEFEVSAGPLPSDTDELVFKALQTYASGEVVRWIEVAPAGGEEPEHPAPVLKLTAAAAADDDRGAAATEDGASASASAEDDDEDDDDDAGTTLGVIALIVGGVALVAAMAGQVRRRSTA